MELRHPPWAAREGLDALLTALGPGAARFVGGAVRDALLGIAAADLDLATVHLPDEVMRRLAAAGLRAVPTGLAHGTVTAVLPSGPVEVTTLRRDVETDGRHAVVAFTDDWRADASRRDFTINALYAAPGEPGVFDYFGGLADLAAGRVRFIGDPLRRIAEDHLRILRYFRFHARFGDGLDEAAFAACRARANDLMALSRERIAGELTKLLATPGAVDTVALMLEGGILRPVLPEVDAAGVERLRALAAAEAGAGLPPDPIRSLAALLPADAAEAVGARLRLSNADRQRLAKATGSLGGEGPRALAYRLGPASAVDRLLLHGEDPALVIAWTPPRLPLSGGALIARGIAKGPAVAAALRQVEDRWIAEGFPGAERVQAIADAVADQARSAAISAQASSTSNGRP
jgi:poly(A) polymerase